ncbi:type I restriction-modification system subunit M [Dysgonomonas capnocytophagoides]|uniref:type I restriction-modification system subunit M n=1 Tax=Dysgonomonas capnocytophagoides TaxID=45254 RepID=UPI003994DDA1
MAIKKSELYSSLWASCDALRGGMDASQYKDYVLIMLFIKYISDKYAGVPYAPITVPKGASFKDMVALKGTLNIGDDINKKIIAPIADANKSLGSINVDFNDPEKLGSGKEMVDRLTKLIAIFENPELDFSKNRADGDDILGDAYEYLMRNFATESGKSKGQFYTPAEVSRVIAQIIGINKDTTTSNTTIYDPTCGSGSLLLKVAEEADRNVTIYGQEKESATAALCRMNMVLHNCPTATIICNNNSTLTNPIEEQGEIKTYDYVVANPPFSYKDWSIGLDPLNDKYYRFKDYGIPPEKNGDYAFLLHIIRVLNPRKGKGAIILPHGVLFRGNSEAEIRENLVKRGYIKGIIGLPSNLFYGTGIPACIIVIDKENASNRKSIFMIDAGKFFIKDGNKNRLRDQDMHKIVDIFNKQIEIPGYSRIVPTIEIEQKEYNLNLPRYIDNIDETDKQDIEAHLLGGIPNTDIDALERYWEVYPTLRDSLFEPIGRNGYSKLKIDKEEIKNAIFSYKEFIDYSKKVDGVFDVWKKKNIPILKNIDIDVKPKELIYSISESLLQTFQSLALIDKYDIYQHLMNYWHEIMQDDAYSISDEGWKVAGGKVYRLMKKIENKKTKTTTEKPIEGIQGIESKLIPPYFLVDLYFASEKNVIENMEADRNTIVISLEELEEEHGIEDGLMSEVINEKGKITENNVKSRLKEIQPFAGYEDEIKILKEYLKLINKRKEFDKKIKAEKYKLELLVWDKYGVLSVDEIKNIVVDRKWIAILDTNVKQELQRISQRLAWRIKDLTERYESPMPSLIANVKLLEEKVNSHLEKMGFTWKK